MANLTLRQLEYFVACAELGSMTAAAERIRLSQSAVSTALADLERALGVQLLIRHARGLSLTPAGERVLSDARRLMGAAEDLHTSARSIGQSLTGGLRIGCYSTIAPILLPKVVADFTDAHPEVDLDILEGSHAFLQDQLRSGGCEVALMYDYEHKTSNLPADLLARVVRSAPPHLVMPADHRLASRKRIRLREVSDDPFILFDLQPGGEYFEDIFTRLGLQPNVRFRTQSFEMVRSLVARGLGYSMLTQRTEVTTSYEGKELIVRPLADALPSLNVVIVQLAGARPTRRASAFAQQCLQSLGDGKGTGS
ncbi:LysR family transcriptional regulator [Aeromicrobium sp. P5_D10]